MLAKNPSEDEDEGGPTIEELEMNTKYLTTINDVGDLLASDYYDSLPEEAHDDEFVPENVKMMEYQDRNVRQAVDEVLFKSLTKGNEVIDEDFSE